MLYISMLLLAVAATTDSFIIGFNYGIKSVKISRLSNLLISALCFSGTLVSMLLGKAAASLLTPAATEVIGGAVLSGLGVYMLIGALDARKSKKEKVSANPEIIDIDGSKVIEARESFLIGLLLSLNNMGLGAGAGISGFSIWLTPLTCALCSYSFIGAGCFLGGKIKNPGFSRVLEIACSLLIIVLGGHCLWAYFF